MALNVDKVYRFIQFVANKESRGWVSPAEFNIAAELAQIAVYSQREAVFLQTKKILNDMRPFMKKANLTVAGGVPSTHFTYPSDMRHFIEAYETSDTAGTWVRPIVELTQAEYSNAKNSTIAAPSATYPNCVQRYDGLYVYPMVSYCMAEFLEAPTAPEWVDTGAGVRPIYDSGASTDFGFDDILFLEIATMVLANVGMNIKDEAVTQYGMAFNAQK